MGQEVRCTGRLAGAERECVAMLESAELVVRAGERLRIPFDGIEDLRTGDGWLTLRHADGELALELGSRAERWAERIRNPPTLADKLGLKEGQRVALVDVDHGDLPRLAAERGSELVQPGDGPNLIVFQADDPVALGRLPGLAAALAAGGAVWVVHPRGSEDVPERDVLAAGRATGLVDTKVARFSDTHTTHRFSTPRAGRR